jgi:hypothetical protein
MHEFSVFAASPADPPADTADVSPAPAVSGAASHAPLSFRVLFAGDLFIDEFSVFSGLLAPCDVFVVPHHGSGKHSSHALFQSVPANIYLVPSGTSSTKKKVFDTRRRQEIWVKIYPKFPTRYPYLPAFMLYAMKKRTAAGYLAGATSHAVAALYFNVPAASHSKLPEQYSLSCGPAGLTCALPRDVAKLLGLTGDTLTEMFRESPEATLHVRNFRSVRSGQSQVFQLRFPLSLPPVTPQLFSFPLSSTGATGPVASILELPVSLPSPPPAAQLYSVDRDAETEGWELDIDDQENPAEGTDPCPSLFSFSVDPPRASSQSSKSDTDDSNSETSSSS